MHINNLILNTILIALLASPCGSVKASYETASGNPVLKGWYADPEGTVLDGKYWIFPTLSDYYAEEGMEKPAYPDVKSSAFHQHYNIQTYLDCFSSKDLVHWRKHHKYISNEEVKWVKYAFWAPAIVEHRGKYYLFFSGNDIQSDHEYGGIGVAVADKPQGPYKDAIGGPLVDRIINGAQPIDQFVFKDDDGAHYMYYGGWHHCNMVKLSEDLLEIVPFDNGTLYKEVTPENYVEGPFMFKRGGKYYFMWSEGGWGGPDYSVSYSIADSPFGPFERVGKILQQDPQVATGAGHHSVIKVPSRDEYYIVYHRRPLGDEDMNHRQTCIERMEFDSNGLIVPVKLTFEGVGEVPLK